MKKRLPRKTRPITRARLENIALHYVSRYAATRAMLRRVLNRRVLLKAQREGNSEVPAEAREWIAEICVAYEKRGWVDDGRLADSLASNAAARGLSRKMLMLKMRQKGLEPSTIRGAIAKRSEEHPDEDDLTAARHFARKKNLGPWRKKKGGEDERKKDLAKLCRAGFSFETAKAALKKSG
jgi:regulatory protein